MLQKLTRKDWQSMQCPMPLLLITCTKSTFTALSLHSQPSSPCTQTKFLEKAVVLSAKTCSWFKPSTEESSSPIKKWNNSKSIIKAVCLILKLTQAVKLSVSELESTEQISPQISLSIQKLLMTWFITLMKSLSFPLKFKCRMSHSMIFQITKKFLKTFKFHSKSSETSKIQTNTKPSL